MSDDFDDKTPDDPRTQAELGFAVRDINRRLKGGNAKFSLLTKALFVVATIALGSLGSAIGMAYKAGSFVTQSEAARALQLEQGKQLNDLSTKLRDQTEALRLLQQQVSLNDSLRQLERKLDRPDPLGRRKPR